MQHSVRQSGIHRPPFAEIKSYLQQFQESDESMKKWFILLGLRGVGKTTILTQLYLDCLSAKGDTFFISLENMRFVGATMGDVINVVEQDFLKTSFVATKKPVYLFLDEVQYLDDWALGLKIIFDKSPNIFIVCTGSSALDLQINQDVARRSVSLPVHPLSFNEYLSFDNHFNHCGHPLVDDALKIRLRSALLESQDADQVFSGISDLQTKLDNYWRQIKKPQIIEDYICYGTLPYVVAENELWFRMKMVEDSLGKSLQKDIVQFEQRYATGHTAFYNLLRLLAESDVISLDNLATLLHLNKRTVANMLKILGVTEIIVPIAPLGSAYRRINRPTKYLFASSSLRLMLAAKSSGSIFPPPAVLKGRLLEDLVALYLHRIIGSQGVFYDSQPKGADFILFESVQGGTAVVIEVGWRKRNTNQVQKTLAKTQGKYGLVISSVELGLSKDRQAVFVPLKYFLLI